MKRIITFLSIIAMIFALTACGQEDITTAAVTEAETQSTEETGTQWVVYWYLCGSDLESNYGSATTDLNEMLEVSLPENVQVVIQTGGAASWQNDTVSADKSQRFLYDSEGLNLIEESDPVNMGDPQTLIDFLTFAKENYPGKHTMVTFWNHGGGSVGGAAFDEQFQMDSLTLDEMYGAFTSVWEENKENQPIDIVGFDTCLMATVDTAFTFSDLGKYLIASEELEPGNGWLYSGWLSKIAENPQMEPIEVAKAICDSYVDGCEEVGTQDNITLSVTDLSKVEDLVTAYEEFGKEALSSAVQDSAFFAHFSQVAGTIENFGGNTREQGFTNMADLGDLAENAADILPQTSTEVLNALDYAVVYKVNGKYRQNSQGLSCYYSYNGDVDDFNKFSQLGASESFKYLYAYGLTGELSQEGMDYLAEMNYQSLPELKTLESVDWEDTPLTVDDEGCATLTLGPEAADILSSITFDLYYADSEEDILLCLGTDNDIIADWDNGVFKDNFRGVWGSIDGALCYMEISYEGDGFNEYAVPVLLNGEEYNLSVIYDFDAEEYYIQGARKPLDDSGAADKNIRNLVEGDELQTIHYASTLSDESEDLTAVPIDTITVTADTSFSETELGDGLFVLMYGMYDSQNNVNYSEAISIECTDGEIYMIPNEDDTTQEKSDQKQAEQAATGQAATGQATPQETTQTSAANTVPAQTAVTGVTCKITVGPAPYRATMEGAILGNFNTGDQVLLTEVVNEKWGKIYYNNSYYYIWASRCESVDLLNNLDKAQGTMYRVKVDQAPIRDTVDGNIVGNLPKGTVVKVIDTVAKDWGEIIYNNQIYYTWMDKYEKAQ